MINKIIVADINLTLVSFDEFVFAFVIVFVFVFVFFFVFVSIFVFVITAVADIGLILASFDATLDF